MKYIAVVVIEFVFGTSRSKVLESTSNSSCCCCWRVTQALQSSDVLRALSRESSTGTEYRVLRVRSTWCGNTVIPVTGSASTYVAGSTNQLHE